MTEWVFLAHFPTFMHGEKRPSRASSAWSVGDVPGVQKEMNRGLFRNCLRNAGRDQINRKGAADLVSDAIEELRTPGKVFMMVGIEPLLAPDGALDQLKQKGLKIVGYGYSQP